jgi:hypothetical protein
MKRNPQSFAALRIFFVITQKNRHKRLGISKKKENKKNGNETFDQV